MGRITRHKFFLSNRTCRTCFARFFPWLFWKGNSSDTLYTFDIIGVLYNASTLWGKWKSWGTACTVLAICTSSCYNKVLIISTFRSAVHFISITLSIMWHVFALVFNSVLPIVTAPWASLTVTCHFFIIEPTATALFTLWIRFQSTVSYYFLMVWANATWATWTDVVFCRICCPKFAWLALYFHTIFNKAATLWSQPLSRWAGRTWFTRYIMEHVFYFKFVKFTWITLIESRIKSMIKYSKDISDSCLTLSACLIRWSKLMTKVFAQRNRERESTKHLLNHTAIPHSPFHTGWDMSNWMLSPTIRYKAHVQCTWIAARGNRYRQNLNTPSGPLNFLVKIRVDTICVLHTTANLLHFSSFDSAFSSKEGVTLNTTHFQVFVCYFWGELFDDQLLRQFLQNLSFSSSIRIPTILFSTILVFLLTNSHYKIWTVDCGPQITDWV